MSAFVRRLKEPNAMADYETRDVSPRFVLAVALGLFSSMALSILLVFGILRWIVPTTEPSATIFGDRQERAGPRLAVSPAADRDEVQREAEGRLQGYGWADRAAQSAHIPIDRAMAILAIRGWPDQDGQEEGKR
ncbi:hypothetical protein [Rhizobium sp. RCC_161_2]|uniref:hypothetical protein n=1 Tax=Rhizobium sp. RCC_161_2 TaxID=3239219 RepID=UPI00352669D6